MDCSKSVELLSDYYEDALDENYKRQVSRHLAECPPCNGVYYELTTIVVTAHVLSRSDDISYPDENLFWQRLNISMR